MEEAKKVVNKDESKIRKEDPGEKAIKEERSREVRRGSGEEASEGKRG